MFAINKPAPLVDDSLLAPLKDVSPSTLGHMLDSGFAADLAPIVRPARCIGTAFTVRLPSLDSTALHYAVDMLAPGYVLVVDTGGDRTRACLGGGVSFTAIARGAVGIVVDGKVTDYNDLSELGIPVYARGVSPLTTRILGVEGAVNVPVNIDGAVVTPGDIVLADDDGVVFISPSDAAHLADRASKAQQWESEVLIPHIRQGGRISDLSGAAAYVEKSAAEATL